MRVYVETLSALDPFIYIMSTTGGQGRSAQVIQSPQENRAIQANGPQAEGFCGQRGEGFPGGFVFPGVFVARPVHGTCLNATVEKPGLHNARYSALPLSVNRQQTGTRPWTRSGCLSRPSQTSGR